jgi:hypothetical protein
MLRGERHRVPVSATRSKNPRRQPSTRGPRAEEPRYSRHVPLRIIFTGTPIGARPGHSGIQSGDQHRGAADREAKSRLAELGIAERLIRPDERRKKKETRRFGPVYWAVLHSRSTCRSISAIPFPCTFESARFSRRATPRIREIHFAIAFRESKAAARIENRPA